MCWNTTTNNYKPKKKNLSWIIEPLFRKHFAKSSLQHSSKNKKTKKYMKIVIRGFLLLFHFCVNKDNVSLKIL